MSCQYGVPLSTSEHDMIFCKEWEFGGFISHMLHDQWPSEDEGDRSSFVLLLIFEPAVDCISCTLRRLLVGVAYVWVTLVVYIDIFKYTYICSKHYFFSDAPYKISILIPSIIINGTHYLLNCFLNWSKVRWNCIHGTNYLRNSLLNCLGSILAKWQEQQEQTC